MGTDHYWGENVWNNFSVSGDAAVGYSFPRATGTATLGGFVSSAHFDRNSDFYTMGHGGYFSPSFFFMAGPMVRFRTERSHTWALDVQASTGYLYYETDSSPVYPRDDSPEKYPGDRFSGLGYSGSLRALKLLTPHWAAGAYAGMDKSSGYTRWSVGVSLSWFFQERKSLGILIPRYEALFEPVNR